jgi:hypothetical protein
MELPLEFRSVLKFRFPGSSDSLHLLLRQDAERAVRGCEYCATAEQALMRAKARSSRDAIDGVFLLALSTARVYICAVPSRHMHALSCRA